MEPGPPYLPQAQIRLFLQHVLSRPLPDRSFPRPQLLLPTRLNTPTEHRHLRTCPTKLARLPPSRAATTDNHPSYLRPTFNNSVPHLQLVPQPRCTPVPSHVCIYPPHLQRRLQLPLRRSATLRAVTSPIFYDSLISLNITAPPPSASEPIPYDSYSFHLTTLLSSIPSLSSLSSTPVLSPYLFSHAAIPGLLLSSTSSASTSP